MTDDGIDRRTRLGEPLSPRQSQVYEYMKTRYASTTQCPTVSEIAAEMGVARNAVQGYMRVLIAKGAVVQDAENASRCYRPVGVSLPPLRLDYDPASLTPIEARVLSAFTGNYRRGLSPPSIREIAADIGRAHGTVYKAIRRLMGMGLVLNSGPGTSRGYRLNRKEVAA